MSTHRHPLITALSQHITPQHRKLVEKLTLVLSLLLPFHAGAEVPVVAISQLVEHPSLNETRVGLIDALRQAGYEDDKTIKILYENANGNLPIAAQIAQKLSGLSPNVIVAISTPSAQTVAAATEKNQIPVVFASVTDPIGAKLVSNLQKPGGHITGAIDAVPVAEQIAYLQKVLPHVKNIGVIYNAAEANSVSMIAQLKTIANQHQLNIIEATTASSNEVIPALQSLIGKIDVLYLPLDNTVISATDAVLGFAKKHRIPTLASETQTTAKGALIGVGFNHHDVGMLAGQKVVAILQGKPTGDIPVEAPQHIKTSINVVTAKIIGVAVPQAFIDQAQEVIR